MLLDGLLYVSAQFIGRVGHGPVHRTKIRQTIIRQVFHGTLTRVEEMREVTDDTPKPVFRFGDATDRNVVAEVSKQYVEETCLHVSLLCL